MLQNFLNEKPLYYDEIDYTRMPRIYEKVKEHFIPTNIIHLVGTNAKGTTGRFLASALKEMGYKVGHYTSPHILSFNERIWLDGSEIDNDTLEFYHDILQRILSKEDSQALSYFEYTTFLAMLIFNTSDYIVLEAGLGGEYDATAVFDKTLTLVTPIDFDHETFLGNSIDEIATTKLNAIKNNAIMAKQKFNEVNTIARKIGLENGVTIQNVEECLQDDDRQKIVSISKNLSLAPYLTQNLSLAIAALKFFNLDYKIDHFKESKLFGRLSQIKENIIVDVGHNPLAAQAICDTLSPNKYILVYNSYLDKNYKQILKILQPIIAHVELIEIQNQRVQALDIMENTLQDLNIKYSLFEKVDDDKNYLVFGSFSVVETFLRDHCE